MTYKWSEYADNIMADFQRLINEQNQAIFDHAYEKVEAYISEVQAENTRLRAELDAERERNRWIPVGERPKKDGEYLVSDKWMTVFEADYDSSIGFIYEDCNGDRFKNMTITHWRLKPEPPVDAQEVIEYIDP